MYLRGHMRYLLIITFLLSLFLNCRKEKKDYTMELLALYLLSSQSPENTLCGLSQYIDKQNFQATNTDTTGSTKIYYVSSSGDDNNDGLSPSSAWRTINRINQEEFVDNSAILFKRGETFRGEMVLTKTPSGTIIGAYGGSGNAPVLKGSVEITGWTKTTNSSFQDKDHIYEADVSGNSEISDHDIRHLFMNDELLTIARYPNVDSPTEEKWLTVDSVSGTSILDAELQEYGKADAYWTGANLRIRNYSWTFKVSTVSAYSSADGKITPSQDVGISYPDWGYYLDNKMEELDHPGEWYYDKANKKIYLWAYKNANPKNQSIEGMIYDTGISLGVDDSQTVIRDIQFKHYKSNGIKLTASPNTTIENNYFENNYTGIYTWKSQNIQIKNNHFSNQLKNAIVLQAPSSFDLEESIVEKNTIKDTAMYPIYGVDYQEGTNASTYQGNAIEVFGTAYTVRENTIENTGHGGINLKDGGHHTIEKNIICKSLLLLNDGGGIIMSSDGNQIKNNFIFETYGNVKRGYEGGSNGQGGASGMYHSTYGMGIGADSNHVDNVIEGNTIVNNRDMGIRLNAYQNTNVKDNVLYNNDPGIVLEDKNGTSSGNTVTGNYVLSFHPDQLSLSITNSTNHGSFDNNHYCNPFNKAAIKRDNLRYTVEHWKKTFTSYGQNSTNCKLNTTVYPYYSTTKVGQNLIENSNFDSDISDWGPTTGDSITYDNSQTDLDGGSLKAIGNGSKLFLSPNLFSLEQGKFYRLKFDVVSSGYGIIQVRWNDTSDGAPQYIIGERYLGYDTEKTSYEFVLESPTSTDSGKLLLTTDSTTNDEYPFWIDNVYIEEVNSKEKDYSQQFRLLPNPTSEVKKYNMNGYLDMEGNQVNGIIEVAPYSSKIYIIK